ncbi:MAG: serine/threonine-protein phosphatase [Chloroflexi bacterium]|nr:serine/threonine-protein phosphatase [Chloroflexota bacterium]
MRTSNQDAVVTCPEAAFFAVIDGVGGAAHGRETARYLSEKLPQVMRSLAHELSDSLSASIGAKLLRNKIAEISDSLYAEHSIDGKTDYSAAIACLWLVRKSAIVLHLGDCRIYILPKDTDNLLCLTKDHNRAFDAVASGNMTDYEARTAGLSSKLTRYVGMAPQAQLDVEVYPVTAGDQFLLCSDGLYSSVAENELTRIMREGMNEEEIPRRMVQTACDAGSRDNVTAQYVMILEK